MDVWDTNADKHHTAGDEEAAVPNSHYLLKYYTLIPFHSGYTPIVSYFIPEKQIIVIELLILAKHAVNFLLKPITK